MSYNVLFRVQENASPDLTREFKFCSSYRVCEPFCKQNGRYNFELYNEVPRRKL